MSIQTQLSQLTDGLYVISESDYPFEVLTLDPEMMVAALTPEDILLQLAPLAVAWQNRTPDEFLGRMCRIADWMTEEECATANRFAALLSFVNNDSDTVGVFKVGIIKIECYIIGRTCAGEWWAIKTHTVET